MWNVKLSILWGCVHSYYFSVVWQQDCRLKLSKIIAVTLQYFFTPLTWLSCFQMERPGINCNSLLFRCIESISPTPTTRCRRFIPITIIIANASTSRGYVPDSSTTNGWATLGTWKLHWKRFVFQKKGKNKNRRKQQPGNKYYAEIFMVLGAMSERNNNNNNNPNCFSYMPALFE